MANSAGDARGSELEIRRKMLEDRAVDVMVSVGRTSSTPSRCLAPVVPGPGQEEDGAQG